jgi:hypothetical protein
MFYISTPETCILKSGSSRARISRKRKNAFSVEDRPSAYDWFRIDWKAHLLGVFAYFFKMRIFITQSNLSQRLKCLKMAVCFWALKFASVVFLRTFAVAMPPNCSLGSGPKVKFWLWGQAPRWSFWGGGLRRALRRGLTLGSGPDEKVARDFTSVPDPSERRSRRKSSAKAQRAVFAV